MDDDESGLELSLGLGCGGSASKSKCKNGSSSDSWPEGGDKGNKPEDDVKHFFHVSAQKQYSSSGSHRTDTMQHQENFLSNLSKSNADANAMHLNNPIFWDSNTHRSDEIGEEKRSDTGNKRKMSFEDITNFNKHKRDANSANLHEKRTSYISITDDGSTADNEDVAESEVEGCTQVSYQDNGSKRFSGFGGSSKSRNKVQLYPESRVVDLECQTRLNDTLGTEFKHGNPNYQIPFSVQSVNSLNVPFSMSVKESNLVGAAGSSNHPLISMMQMTPTPNGEQPKGFQSVNPGNSHVNYPSVQLPTLDSNTSWVMDSHSQPINSTYAGSCLPGLDKKSDGLKASQASPLIIPRNLSEPALNDTRFSERARGDDKQQNKEDGSSSCLENDAKWSNMNIRPKDTSERLTTENFLLDFSAIKPGIAADVKFGGCGSYPNLPWVSTTAPGPNGRTISGVTYRYSANQVKIVCACHGSHMSPEEFVRHASEENLENNGIAAFPNTNPAAFAPS